MKFQILSTTLLLITLLLACKPTSLSQSISTTSLNDSITITGRVVIEGSESPPQGLVTINIKNSWNWADKNIKGENKRVYANKEGYYFIKIRKRDSLVLLANTKLYKRVSSHETASLIKDQTIDFKLIKNQEKLEKTKQNPKVYANLLKHLNNVDPEKLVTVSGCVLNRKTNKPIKSVLVMQPWVHNTDNYLTFHLTDSLGKFSIRVPKGDLVTINSLAQESQRVILYPQRDTILNITLPIITNQTK